MKWFGKDKPSVHTPSVCPDCGCPLQDISWRHCPRCRREVTGCSGCGNCGRHR